jgi:hypothetical protein
MKEVHLDFIPKEIRIGHSAWNRICSNPTAIEWFFL